MPGCCYQFEATPAGGVPPYTYAWDFDDGETSTLAAPCHCFTLDGTYEVLVTVTDACGSTAIDPVTVEVTGCTPVDTGCCEESIPGTLYVAVTATGTPLDGNTYPMVWDAGNGWWEAADPATAGCDCLGASYRWFLQCEDVGGGVFQWNMNPVAGYCGPSVSGLTEVSCDPLSLTGSGTLSDCDTNAIAVSVAVGTTP